MSVPGILDLNGNSHKAAQQRQHGRNIPPTNIAEDHSGHWEPTLADLAEQLEDVGWPKWRPAAQPTSRSTHADMPRLERTGAY